MSLLASQKANKLIVGPTVQAMRSLGSWRSELSICVAGQVAALQLLLGACEMLRKDGKNQTIMDYQRQAGRKQVQTSFKS